MNPVLALRLFQVALDLADAREGALFVVLRDPDEAAPQLVAPADRLDIAIALDAPAGRRCRDARSCTCSKEER
jgi:hypothetical protein